MLRRNSERSSSDRSDCLRVGGDRGEECAVEEAPKKEKGHLAESGRALLRGKLGR